MTDLITLIWSFSLHRLLTLKRNPVISLKHELVKFLVYGVFFFIVLTAISLIMVLFN